MAPAVIHVAGEGDIHKGTPFWTLGLFQQMHPGLVRQTVPLPGIAGDAGADHIFPSSLSSTVSWEDMVDIEMAPVKVNAAVLAGILIALKDIVPREFDLFLWQAVKEAKDNDPGDTDAQRNRLEHSGLRIGD